MAHTPHIAHRAAPSGRDLSLDSWPDPHVQVIANVGIVRERRVVDGQLVTGGDCCDAFASSYVPLRHSVGSHEWLAKWAAVAGREHKVDVVVDGDRVHVARLGPPRTSKTTMELLGVTRGGLRSGPRPHLLRNGALRSGRARRSMRRPPTRRDGARRRLAVVRSPRRQSNAGGAPTVGQAVRATGSSGSAPRTPGGALRVTRSRTGRRTRDTGNDVVARSWAAASVRACRTKRPGVWPQFINEEPSQMAVADACDAGQRRRC